MNFVCQVILSAACIGLGTKIVEWVVSAVSKKEGQNKCSKKIALREVRRICPRSYVANLLLNL